MQTQTGRRIDSLTLLAGSLSLNFKPCNTQVDQNKIADVRQNLCKRWVPIVSKKRRQDLPGQGSLVQNMIYVPNMLDDWRDDTGLVEFMHPVRHKPGREENQQDICHLEKSI